MFIQLRRELIVRFVDIDVIIDQGSKLTNDPKHGSQGAS
jgi:hypothetical protein